MNRRFGWMLVGVFVGVLAVGPLQGWSEAGTGKATIPINDRVLAVTRIDVGPQGSFAR